MKEKLEKLTCSKNKIQKIPWKLEQKQKKEWEMNKRREKKMKELIDEGQCPTEKETIWWCSGPSDINVSHFCGTYIF